MTIDAFSTVVVVPSFKATCLSSSAGDVDLQTISIISYKNNFNISREKIQTQTKIQIRNKTKQNQNDTFLSS